MQSMPSETQFARWLDILYAVIATILFCSTVAVAMFVEPAYGAEVDNHRKPEPQPQPVVQGSTKSSNDATWIVGLAAVTIGYGLYVDHKRKQKVALQIDRIPDGSPVVVVKFEQRF